MARQSSTARAGNRVCNASGKNFPKKRSSYVYNTAEYPPLVPDGRQRQIRCRAVARRDLLCLMRKKLCFPVHDFGHFDLSLIFCCAFTIPQAVASISANLLYRKTFNLRLFPFLSLKNSSLDKIEHIFIHRCVKFPSRRLQFVRFPDIGINDGKIVFVRRKFIPKPLARIRVAVR